MGCNKVSYSTIKEAKTAIHNMKNSRKFNRKSLKTKSRAYRCPACESYHLTTMTAVEQKRQKKKIREKTRRLDVIAKIRGSKNIVKIFELQEHWMTLILEESKWILECEVFEYIYCVEGQEV